MQWFWNWKLFCVSARPPSHCTKCKSSSRFWWHTLYLFKMATWDKMCSMYRLTYLPQIFTSVLHILSSLLVLVGSSQLIIFNRHQHSLKCTFEMHKHKMYVNKCVPFDSRWAVWYRKEESEAEPDSFERQHAEPSGPVHQDVNTFRPPNLLQTSDSHVRALRWLRY